jgi:hypothetical protein
VISVPLTHAVSVDRSRSARFSIIEPREHPQKRPPQAHAVVRRDPQRLSLEKSQGDPIWLMFEDARGCARIRIWVGQFVERS